MTGVYNRKEREIWTQRHLRQGPVKVEAETKDMVPQTKEL